jgi:hypothetical protein
VDEEYSGKEQDVAIKLRLEAGAGFKNIEENIGIQF